MRMQRFSTALAAVALSATATAGCTAAPPSNGPGTLAIVMPALEGRFQDVADALRAEAEDAGYTVEVRGTDGDIPAQVTTVQEFLDEGVEALVVWPIDQTSLVPVVDEAPEGTAVVSMGTLVRDTARLDAHVGFDARAAGAAQARLLLEGLGLLAPEGTATATPAPSATPASGPFRIELVAGSPDDQRTAPAYAGAMSVLEPYLDSGTLVVGSGETELSQVTTLRGSDATAAERLTGIIADHYAGAVPDAVLATSDELARGVATALLDAGAVPGDGFPVVTGRGCELRSLAALVDGRQYATLLEDPRVLAAAAMRVLRDGASAADGATVDNGAGAIPAALVAGVPVRAGDIDDLVIGSGYWSRDRVDDAIAEFGLPAP
jgi:putative multiple sugar transport system substrate-binding protein